MAVARKRWITYGPRRGLGPVRDREAEARQDAIDDVRKCKSVGGTSDREEYMVDVDGYLRGPDGSFVYAKPRLFYLDPYTGLPVTAGDERDGAIQI